MISDPRDATRVACDPIARYDRDMECSAIRVLALVAMSVGAGSPATAQPTAFGACLASVRTQALAEGITAATFDVATKDASPDPTVIEALNYQPEFKTPIWDYLAGLVDAERIADGKAKLAEWSDTLGEAEGKFGVDRHVLVAVWGVESNYGRAMGTRPLVRSLATLSCEGRRQSFFRGELIATLRILQDGDIPLDRLVGSWAGAFGHTQFMPSTFRRLAVDFDGDGRRDIIGSASDSIASTANYLKRAGWITGTPWGYEVRVPAGYTGDSGRRNKVPLALWRARGLTRIDGTALTGEDPGGLLLPAGADGPAFLVFRNFDAIYSYNPSESYALAIAHLSDRLRGGGPIVRPWPTDDRGLSRAERREVQRLLITRGYEIGEPDGVIGSRTRAAIKQFQERADLPVDGRAGGRLLEALRRTGG